MQGKSSAVPELSYFQHLSPSVVAARGIFSGAVATGVLGFITAILFLFCIPDFQTLFALNAPQPFVQIYAVALGRGGAVFMTILAIIGLVLVRDSTTLPMPIRMRAYRRVQNTSIAVVAASRLIFAVARDGVLPGSKWIGQVNSDGQPRNAVTVMFVFGAALLCSILPSQVAFTSLVSAGAVPTIAAYGLIALLRLTMTPNSFRSTHFKLGKFRKPFYLAAALFNGLVFAVSYLPRCLPVPECLICAFKVMLSPFVFPVTSQTFNFVSREQNISIVDEY